MEKTEKNLWEILQEKYGFKPHVYKIAVNPYQEFREMWLPKFWIDLFPIKTIEKSSEDWMSTTINGDKYEVAMVDIWYVQLRKNGIIIFDGRRFNNEDFLKLLA